MDDHALCNAQAQQTEHLIEDRSALFGGSFPFFKPADDFQTMALSIPTDRIFLFRKRDTSSSLSGCRHPGVSEYFAHGDD
jgi:hypothetical protein